MTSEFLTKAKFSKLVESTVRTKNMNYIDAALFACEKYGVDPIDVRKFLSSFIKEKIEAEAKALNFLEKENEGYIL